MPRLLPVPLTWLQQERAGQAYLKDTPEHHTPTDKQSTQASKGGEECGTQHLHSTAKDSTTTACYPSQR